MSSNIAALRPDSEPESIGEVLHQLREPETSIQIVPCDGNSFVVTFESDRGSHKQALSSKQDLLNFIHNYYPNDTYIVEPKKRRFFF